MCARYVMVWGGKSNTKPVQYATDMHFFEPMDLSEPALTLNMPGDTPMRSGAAGVLWSSSVYIIGGAACAAVLSV